MLPCAFCFGKTPTPFQPIDPQRINPAKRRWRCSTVVRAEKSTYSGKGVAPPAKGHHFLHIDDFSTDEIRAMLQTAAKARLKGPHPPVSLVSTAATLQLTLTLHSLRQLQPPVLRTRSSLALPVLPIMRRRATNASVFRIAGRQAWARVASPGAHAHIRQHSHGA